MSRKPALKPAQRLQASHRLAAGESARAISREFGCDVSVILKIPPAVTGKTTAIVQKALAAPRGLTNEPDEFESAQLEAIKLIDARLKPKETGEDNEKEGLYRITPHELAVLIKTKNDTIKQLRHYRALRDASHADAEGSAGVVAENVKIKLRNLAEHRARAAKEKAPEAKAEPEAKTGT